MEIVSGSLPLQDVGWVSRADPQASPRSAFWTSYVRLAHGSHRPGMEAKQGFRGSSSFKVEAGIHASILQHLLTCLSPLGTILSSRRQMRWEQSQRASLDTWEPPFIFSGRYSTASTSSGLSEALHSTSDWSFFQACKLASGA